MPRNPYEPPREECREAESEPEGPDRTRRLFGMTIIEWLVVLAIVGGLGSLLPGLFRGTRHEPN